VIEFLQAPELTEEQKEYIAKAAADKEATAAEDVEARGPTSFFHGKADKDYQVGHVHMFLDI
jgi:pre-mRNA-processing factor 17